MKVDDMKLRRSGAFTLIEVLVTVAILVLLISLLVPAVSGARSSARKAATNTQMRSIALACESYFQTFQAYPGALSEDTYTGTLSVPFTSSQALVVSLTRAFFTAAPATTPPGPAQQIGTLPFFVSLNPAISPRDYSENAPSGRSYDAFLNPAPTELSSAVGVFGASTDTPTFIDSAFGTDALPILYYRPARKYDPSIQAAGTGPYMQPISENSATFASFYAQSNEYLASQTGSSKTLASSGIGNLNTTTPANNTSMQNLLFQTVNNNLVARGSFVLISAGADRIYGPDPKGNVDDIIVAGGK